MNACPFCNNCITDDCCDTWRIYCENLKTGKPDLSRKCLKNGKYVSNGDYERNKIEMKRIIN